MSMQLFGDDVIFLQRFLKCCSMYGGNLDGIWGPKTDAAVTAFEAQTDTIAAELGAFDRASERNIRSLQPKAQRAARQFLKQVQAANISARILSGTRTYAEQDVLFGKGRNGDKSSIVTNAPGGKSNHNFGIAWDIGIFRDGTYLGNSPQYAGAGSIGKSLGLEWGGDWHSFVDQPHFQLATGMQLASVRMSFEAGTVFV